MDATGEDARLYRSHDSRRAEDAGLLHAGRERLQQSIAGGIATGKGQQINARTKCGRIVGRIAGAARNDFGGGVLQDQDRCFA